MVRNLLFFFLKRHTKKHRNKIYKTHTRTHIGAAVALKSRNKNKWWIYIYFTCDSNRITECHWKKKRTTYTRYFIKLCATLGSWTGIHVLLCALTNVIGMRYERVRNLFTLECAIVVLFRLQHSWNARAPYSVSSRASPCLCFCSFFMQEFWNWPNRRSWNEMWFWNSLRIKNNNFFEFWYLNLTAF